MIQVSNFSRVLLCLAGGIAIAIGGLVLYSPADFYVLNRPQTTEAAFWGNLV